MTDYISREEAIEAIGEMPLNWTDSPEELQETADWEEHLHAIIAVPAADVVSRDCFNRLLVENDELRKVRPVVRGMWIDHQIGNWVYAKCSECGTVHDVKSHFCPHCGADMRKEATDAGQDD